MSGGMAVLALIASNFMSRELREPIWGVPLLGLRLVIWRSEQKRKKLIQSAIPTFKVWRDPELWRSPGRHNGDHCFYLRISVINIGEQTLEKCQARLESIQKDGVDMAHPIRTLAFEPSHAFDAAEKTIHPNGRYLLDVLVVTERNSVFVATPGVHEPALKITGEQIFGGIGTYDLFVKISGVGGATLPVHLQCVWNGSWETAQLTVLQKSA